MKKTLLLLTSLLCMASAAQEYNVYIRLGDAKSDTRVVTNGAAFTTNHDFSVVTQKISSVESGLFLATNSLDSIQSGLDNLADAYSTTSNSVAGVKSDLDNLADAYSTTSNSVESAASNIAALSESLSFVSNKVEDVSEEISSGVVTTNHTGDVSLNGSFSQTNGVVRIFPTPLSDGNPATGFIIGGVSLADLIGEPSTSSPIVDGAAKNSAVQIGSEAVTLSVGSTAIGSNTVAGLRGYYYLDRGTVSNSLTLSVSPSSLSVGDVVSVVNDSKYPNCAVIASISGSTVTFSNNLPFSSIVSIQPDKLNFDDYTLYVSAKPHIGITDIGRYSFASGFGTHALNYASTAEGRDTYALGEYSHAEGRDTLAQYCAHAEGKGTKAAGEYTHAEGYATKAYKNNAHAEGSGTTANGDSSHAEGFGTETTGAYSHAEGNGVVASGNSSHAEGFNTTASGTYSHAEGSDTQATSFRSHSEGASTISSAADAHAEGNNTEAAAQRSHSEGYYTHTYGINSHAEGYLTKAYNPSEHAQGQANLSHTCPEFNKNNTYNNGDLVRRDSEIWKAKWHINPGTEWSANNWSRSNSGNSGITLHSIGIGTSDASRTNAVEVMQDGKVFVYGVGGYNGTNPTEPGVKDLASSIGSTLAGKSYDLNTDSGIVNALSDIIRSLGGESSAPSTETVFKFTDGTQESFQITGDLNWSVLSDLGLYNIQSRTWTKDPTDCDIGYGVSKLGGSVFSSCSTLRSVKIPDSVTNIDFSAFYQCTSLTNIYIPDSVVFIGDECFSECSSLRRARLSESLTALNGEVFAYCSSLTYIYIPRSVKSIRVNTFTQSGLCSVSMSDGVSIIDDAAFSYLNNLMSITVGPSVTRIDRNAFRNSSNIAVITFVDKSQQEVMAMNNYPWGLGSSVRLISTVDSEQWSPQAQQ